MPLIQDKYFVEDWFNSIFTELDNIEVEARPTKSGFLHQRYSFRKRDGLFTPSDDSRQAASAADFKWAWYQSSVLYPYDANWEIYSFDWADLTQLTTDGQTYDGTYLNHTVKLSYVWGWRYPNDSTEYTVSSYSESWVAPNIIGTITVSETDFDSSYIDKYVYVDSGTAAGIRQYARISTVPANNQITIDSVFDVGLTSWDKLHIYDELKNQIWYPQLRQTSDTDYLLARDGDGNFWNRYMPNARKIIQHDARLVYLNTEQTAIIVSDNRNLERVWIEPTTGVTQITTLTDDALNITSFSGYVFVFFEDRVGILVKNILDAENPDDAFLYGFEDKLNVWLFSAQSFYNDGTNLYIFGNDRRFYAIDVSISSSGDIQIKAVPQALELSAYFDNISSGEVKFTYTSNRLRMVHVDSNDTTVYLFNQDVNGWYRHTYDSYNDNFFSFFGKIDTDTYTCHDSYIYRMSWLTDNGTNIEQKISFEGPVRILGEYVYLSGIKFRFGFDGNKIGWKVNVKIGGNLLYTATWEISRLQVVDNINAAADGGTFGSMLVGDYLFGGSPGESELATLYNEYIDCRMNVNKQGSHFKVEIVNDTAYQLYFAFAMPDYSQAHPIMVMPTNHF